MPEADLLARVYYCRSCKNLDVSIGEEDVLTDELPCPGCGSMQQAASIASDHIRQSRPRRAFKGL
jgi:DNA-directed RNA polymerase subunit RPC12/RpoP